VRIVLIERSVSEMIYLRCPFCDLVSGEIEGNAILKEPIANYYTDIEPRDMIRIENYYQINGLTYFPHQKCYDIYASYDTRKMIGPRTMM
jgi:hypothetical protein